MQPAAEGQENRSTVRAWWAGYGAGFLFVAAVTAVGIVVRRMHAEKQCCKVLAALIRRLPLLPASHPEPRSPTSSRFALAINLVGEYGIVRLRKPGAKQAGGLPKDAALRAPIAWAVYRRSSCPTLAVCLA